MSAIPCRGHCCHGFTINASYQDLVRDPARFKDGAYLLDMLLPIPRDDDDGVQTFGCRHWDPASGRCTAYESRPWMCRSHPTRPPCGFEKCTLRAGLIGPGRVDAALS